MANDKWQNGAAYERYMGRWSRALAPRFLQWLDVPPARSWLDVGCGTGALCAAFLQHCAPRTVIGVEPSATFLAAAAEQLAPHATFQSGTAGDLPLPDAAVDVAVSSLVLNFVPDAGAALREKTRVTASGGMVAACVWDYAGTMDLIRVYWDAVREIDARAAAEQDQGERFPLCRPDALATAFTQAGLQQVEVAALDLPLRFADFDDYWRPFLGGQGPAPAHAMSLDEPTRARLREHIRQRLRPQHDGSIQLAARAWGVRGIVAR